MSPILYALSLLTPYEVDATKVRIGPNTDGGYVFVDDIVPSQTILSYGISFEYRFDAEMAARGHKVYMFDHTIDGINATHPNMLWFKEGVGGVTDQAASLYSIEDHLAKHGIEGDRLILKMDVEGAEFDAFNHMPDQVLGRFEQIVLEIHGLGQLENQPYRDEFVKMFTKINRQFTLFHVHGNNCDGPAGIEIPAGFPVSSLMELSYVRTSSVRRGPNRTVYPTALDYPNVGRKDKMLWFYPFVPTTATNADFAICEQRLDYIERLRVAGIAV